MDAGIAANSHLVIFIFRLYALCFSVYVLFVGDSLWARLHPSWDACAQCSDKDALQAGLV
jgi:hypothetical protein